MDLNERAASKGELTRFVQKFGIAALIDKNASRYADLGLGATRYGDDRWLDQLCDEPLLLRQPLTRCGPRLSIGLAETDWKRWIDEAKVK